MGHRTQSRGLDGVVTSAAPDATVSRAMRRFLLACGAMNLAGAVAFAPPVAIGRRMLDLPDGPDVYLWVLSAWILAFGLAYAYQGWTGHANRSVLTLGAWGKGTFGVALLGSATTGAISPMAGAAGIPDLVCAVVFSVWLWTAGRTQRW